MKRRDYASLITDLAVPLIVTSVMFIVTKYYRGPGLWFSSVNGYRWQVEAWLHGHFAISPFPFNLWFDDPVWGRGAQQIWGLGAPLLEFPFQAAAALLRWPGGFPERVIFLILYFAAAFVFWRATKTLVNGVLRIPLVLIPFLTPSFLSLSMWRFDPYQTTILYGCLATFTAVALSLECIARPAGRKFFVAAFLCGFLALIKITYAVYGGIVFCLLLYFVAKSFAPKKLAIACALFAAGPVALLATNEIRFGSPLEFGYQLNLSHEIHNDYTLRFGYPYKNVPFWKAAREELGFMFLAPPNGAEPYTQGNFRFEADAPRFREARDGGFRPWHGVLLLLAWLFFARRFRSSRPGEKFFGLTSLVCFVVLFMFYLWRASVSSRYMVDFVPAASFAFIFLYLAIAEMIRKPKGAAALVIVTCLLVSLDLYSGPGRAVSTVGVTDAAGSPKSPAADSLRLSQEIKLPEKYSCRDFLDPVTKKPTRHYIVYGIQQNMNGWDYIDSCYVSSMTELFLENPECVRIEFDVVAKRSDWDPSMQTVDKVDTSVIEARENLVTLRRVEDRMDGQNHVMVFCPEPGAWISDNPFRLLSIKWLPPKDFLAEPPIRLFSVTKVPRP